MCITKKIVIIFKVCSVGFFFVTAAYFSLKPAPVATLSGNGLFVTSVTSFVTANNQQLIKNDKIRQLRPECIS